MKKLLALLLLSACSSAATAPLEDTPPDPSPSPETASAPLDAASPPPPTTDASLPPPDASDAAPPSDPCERTPLTQELCFHSGMTPAWSARRACDGTPFFRVDGGRVERPFPVGCDPTIQSCGLEGCEARVYGSIELWCCAE